MQELTTDQLKEMLNTSVIKGSPEQVRILAIRVKELCQLNGKEWVATNADLLLDQWERILSRMADKQ